MSSRYAASPAAAWRTTSRFIRRGPAPTAARSPAVPNVRWPSNRASSSATGPASRSRSSAWMSASGSASSHRSAVARTLGHGNNVRSATSGRGPTWLITSAAAIEPSRAHSASGRALLYP